MKTPFFTESSKSTAGGSEQKRQRELKYTSTPKTIPRALNASSRGPHFQLGPVLTFRVFDSDGFGNSRSTGTGVVDGNDSDVIICSLRQARHSVRQIFTPVLCAPGPVLLSGQNL